MCPCENMAEHLLGLASECRCYINRRYKTFVSTVHCTLEKLADLYVNEHQKIRHYRARSAEERRRMPNRDFFTSRGCTYLKLRYIAMLYTHWIGNQPYNTTVVFKMRDSVPSSRYSSVCNVLRQWSISLIPTYRVH